MSKLGKELISSLKEAKKTGLVTLQVSPDVGKLRKKLKLTQREFSIVYHINIETLRKWELISPRKNGHSTKRPFLLQNSPGLSIQV